MKLFHSNNPTDNKINPITMLPVVFFAGRLLLYLALMPNDIRGLGDFYNYFSVSNLPGIPFLDFWTEYPPIFSFFLEFLNIISNSNQYLFDFFLYLFVTFCGSISIWLFSKIALDLKMNENDTFMVSFCYFGFLAFISYTWWYFDLIIVCLMLSLIYSLIHNKTDLSGLWLGLGILTKWFPVILLPAIFKYKPRKIFFKISLISIAITVVVWAILFIKSPELTMESLQSQPSRSSWQTIWALIDGNMVTGAYIPIEERFEPSSTNLRTGNPAVIPVWLTFLFFAGIGVILLNKVKLKTDLNLISFIGITWILFLLWSPGWSPQWILYLIPIILLTMPFNKGFLISFLLSLLTLIEWPILLGRQLFIGLWVIVPLRMIIFIYLLFVWIRITSKIQDIDIAPNN